MNIKWKRIDGCMDEDGMKCVAVAEGGECTIYMLSIRMWGHDYMARFAGGEEIFDNGGLRDIKRLVQNHGQTITQITNPAFDEELKELKVGAK